VTETLGWACAAALAALGALALYQWVLAAASMLPEARKVRPARVRRSRFAVLIPAHDEEAGLATTLRSLRGLDYDPALFQAIVVADRCSDRTAEIARSCGAVCLERFDGTPGKGAALAWAIERTFERGTPFDAVAILDADAVADPGFLAAFDDGLADGHEVQQGFNYLSNPWETPFTRIIAVTSVLRNAFFYGGKARLGLPAMLTGSGMCFGRRVLDEHRWTAFSVGEDWEFSVSLLLRGERIHFNRRARAMAQESRGFRQASSQRLRWASGRHGVAAASTTRLLRAGWRLRRPGLWDAALTIVAPTYSAQATLALVCLAAAWSLSGHPRWSFLMAWAAGVVALLGAYFAAGLARTEAPLRAMAGIILIPAFLPWRAAIEVLGLCGCGRRRWVRTARAALVAAALGAAASTSQAQVLFSEDFESSIVNGDGTISSWDGPGNPATMYLTSEVARSGRRSVEMEYLPGSQGASFMYKLLPGQDRMFIRWYQRWSPGFVWEPSATKMTILRPMGGYPQFYPEVMWANGQLAVQAQVIAEANWDSRNFYQNRGEPTVFAAGRWYCIEVFVQLNTPGTADGAVAAWIDGELKLEYTGRRFRGSSPTDPAPSTAQIQAVGLTGYYGGVTPVPQHQRSWQDDVAGSLQRIGCQLVSDDFETNTTGPDGTISGWDGPSRPAAMFLSGDAARSGGRSLAMAYAPESNGAGYMYKHFIPQDRVYLRWYQRWSAGFEFEPSSTSLASVRPSSGYPQFYPFVAGSGGQLAVQAQVLADRVWATENLFQNRGSPIAFEPERWYCIEVLVQLNTPGAADGAVAAWIDGELKMLHAAREFRGAAPYDPAPSTSELSAVLVTGQYGGSSTVPRLQFSWQDDYVASTERVGCGAFAPVHP
jgi:hypothetical protein